MIEVYDFTVFAFLIPILSEVFFSSHTSKVAINFTVLAYVISYGVKPFGAVAFGYLIDAHGRKRVLQFTTLLMTLATAIIGLIPVLNSGGCFRVLIIFAIIQALLNSALSAFMVTQFIKCNFGAVVGSKSCKLSLSTVSVDKLVKKTAKVCVP